MFDFSAILGPHSHFIIAAYSLSAVTLLALIIWVHRKESHYKKMLDLFSEDDSASNV